MILGFLALGLIAYTWAKTDPGGTWSTTRAAGGAGVRTGGRSARSTWDRRRPDRAKQREKRRKQWERSGLIGWSLVQAERGTVGLARLVWDGGAATGRAVWDGGRAARDEWRTTWKAHHPEPTEGGPDGGPDRSTDHPEAPVGRPLPIREPNGERWWEPADPAPTPAREPVLVGGGAIAAAAGRAATPRIDHTPPAGDPIPSPRPAAPPTPEPPDSAPAPAEAPASTDSPFSHGGPPGMSTATVTPGTDTANSNLSGVMKWCEDARAEVESGTTGALVGQASHLYEGFDGAIARIEGKVGEAATAVEEAAAKLKEDLAAFIALVAALREVAAEARGD